MQTTSRRLVAASCLIVAAANTHATEGGGSTYPRGLENYLVGTAPPLGLHLLAYGNYYEASKFKDNTGREASPPGFKIEAATLALRGIWSTPVEFAGGNLVAHTVIPLVNLHVKAAGDSQTRTGIGDITVGVGLANHFSPQLHSVAGLDISLPTGGYDKDDLANIGRNYLSFQPFYALSYVDPKGFNGDVKLTLNLNRRNSSTDYRSGNEVFIDYAAGWGLGNGWVLGVGGHVWQQISDDKQAGVKVDDNRARSFSIGPSVKYQNANGWFLTAKLQFDTSVRNTTKGTSFWLKTKIPF